MVQQIRVNSSNENYNNLNDDSRVYDIESNANIINGVVDSLDSGFIRSSENVVANFNAWGENNINISYQGVTLEERNEINIAVDTFINEVKESVANR